MHKFKKQESGFTLVELMVVLAIIGILASIVLASLRVARIKAGAARAKADMYNLRTAIVKMQGDTTQSPSPSGTHTTERPCVQVIAPVQLGASLPNDVGILADGTTAFPSWQGPYSTAIPNDVWGTSYYFRTNTTCNGQDGCTGYANGTQVSALISFGPDKTENNGGDDIVLVLCK